MSHHPLARHNFNTPQAEKGWLEAGVDLEQHGEGVLVSEKRRPGIVEKKRIFEIRLDVPFDVP